MTLTLICQIVAVVTTAAALALATRRAKLSTATKALFAVTLLALVVAIGLTVVQGATA